MLKHTIAAACLLLAACGGGEEGNNSSESAEGGAAIEQTPPNLQDDPTNSVVPLTTPTTSPTSAPSPVAALPGDFQGRWGMVALDCVPGRGDDKGLMIVAADGLGFFESRASIQKAEMIRPGTLQLELLFSGEGQEWNRQETLTLLDDGKTLVREEQKPAGSFRYTRCPAGKEGPAVPTGA